MSARSYASSANLASGSAFGCLFLTIASFISFVIAFYYSPFIASSNEAKTLINPQVMNDNSMYIFTDIQCLFHTYSTDYTDIKYTTVLNIHSITTEEITLKHIVAPVYRLIHTAI